MRVVGEVNIECRQVWRECVDKECFVLLVMTWKYKKNSAAISRVFTTGKVIRKENILIRCSASDLLSPGVMPYGYGEVPECSNVPTIMHSDRSDGSDLS